MSATKVELLRWVEHLSEDQLREVLACAQLLAQEPEPLAPGEWADVRAGQAEVARGEWVGWPDVRRPSV